MTNLGGKCIQQMEQPLPLPAALQMSGCVYKWKNPENPLPNMWFPFDCTLCRLQAYSLWLPLQFCFAASLPLNRGIHQQTEPHPSWSLVSLLVGRPLTQLADSRPTGLGSEPLRTWRARDSHRAANDKGASPPKLEQVPSHQLTWKCKKALSKRKVVFLQEAVHFHVSCWEGS